MPAAAEWPLAPLRPVDGLDYPHGERRIGSNPFAAKNLHSFSNDSESEWTFSGTVDLSPSQSGVLFSHNSVTALEMCDGMMGGANGWIVLGDNANAFAATAKLGVAIAQDFAGEITVESGGKFSIQTTESGGALTFSGNSPISFSVKHDGGEFSITTAAPGATAILANGSAPVQLDLAFGEIAARGANSTAIDGGGQKYCASGTVPNKMVAKEMAAP